MCAAPCVLLGGTPQALKSAAPHWRKSNDGCCASRALNEPGRVLRTRTAECRACLAGAPQALMSAAPVSYTHLRAHETSAHL
eukprot:15456814-Alexandrium_andersonii.AAC.1